METNHVLVVPKGDERRFLSSLPLTALPDPPIELARRLHLFGITTLGGFAELPHAAVVMQFGAECGFFHDLARGIDPRYRYGTGMARRGMCQAALAART